MRNLEIIPSFSGAILFLGSVVWISDVDGATVGVRDVMTECMECRSNKVNNSMPLLSNQLLPAANAMHREKKQRHPHMLSVSQTIGAYPVRIYHYTRSAQ